VQGLGTGLGEEGNKYLGISCWVLIHASVWLFSEYSRRGNDIIVRAGCPDSLTPIKLITFSVLGRPHRLLQTAQHVFPSPSTSLPEACGYCP